MAEFWGGRMNSQVTGCLLLLCGVIGGSLAEGQQCSSPASCLRVAKFDRSTAGILALENAFSKWPKAHGVATNYGERLLIERRFERAADVYATCSDDHDRTVAANCRVGQAVALANLGRHAAADALLIGLVDSAIARHWYSPSICWRVHVLIDLGDYPQARALFEKGLSLARRPEFRASLLMEEARLALAIGDGETAHRKACVATELNAIPEYRLATSIILVWMGKFEEALDELETVDELGLPNSTRDIPHLLRSAIHGAPDVSVFSNQINTYPGEQAGWFCAGLNQYILGNTTEAIALLDRGRQVAISTITLQPQWVRRKGQSEKEEN